ncbi:hypothetical protein HGRIS_002834 [Hohenbuehelia grisea]|uniref:Uncharacterized protein n=1 Tax=Hohenbuehelia grisea TaxID=104357 RepID=A0ABR3JLU6_9AGAR
MAPLCAASTHLSMTNEFVPMNTVVRDRLSRTRKIMTGIRTLYPTARRIEGTKSCWRSETPPTGAGKDVAWVMGVEDKGRSTLEGNRCDLCPANDVKDAAAENRRRAARRERAAATMDL